MCVLTWKDNPDTVMYAKSEETRDAYPLKRHRLRIHQKMAHGLEGGLVYNSVILDFYG